MKALDNFLKPALKLLYGLFFNPFGFFFNAVICKHNEDKNWVKFNLLFKLTNDFIKYIALVKKKL